MNLFKNCKRHHDISQGWETLRIGTLYGYRKAEDPDIRDEGEGSYFFEVSLNESTKFSRKNANLIFPFMSFGETYDHSIRDAYNAHATGLRIRTGEAGDDQVTLDIKSLKLKRHSPDQFVFCMSHGDGNPPTISSAYDSHWSITEKNAPAFAEGMSNAIIESLIADPTQVTGLDKDNIKNLKIVSNHSKVIYIPREFNTADLKDHNLNDIMERIINMPFIKPPKYSPEEEYRFSFEITDGERFYPPSSDNIKIRSSFAHELLR
jgi:hypothetical protein